MYLNENWDGASNGGQLRLHERAQPAATAVGANGADLQVGWLRATGGLPEEPVFLDPLRPGPEEATCMLYTSSEGGAKRYLSREPFANKNFYLPGGDAVASKLMLDDPAEAKRFHLIDARQTLVSSLLPSPGPQGEDGGERVRDIVPAAGTLVMFDSVSLPHEVLESKGRERYGIQGWFHEKMYY